MRGVRSNMVVRGFSSLRKEKEDEHNSEGRDAQ